jgi:hypothetical protein
MRSTPRPRHLLLVASVLLGLGLSGCRPGFRIRHHLRVTRSGFLLDGKPVDSARAADSLKPFCAEHETRHMWRLEGDTGLTSKDFVQFLSWVSKVNVDCRGLFALQDGDQPVLLQPPVPAPRSIYSFNAHDTIRPHVSLMVQATRDRIRFWTDGEWLPDIDVVRDAKGNEYVASGKDPAKVSLAWRDEYGRCLVEVRKDHCTDSLWPGTRYVLLGNLVRLPDTIDPRSKKDMGWVGRGPLTRDIAVGAEIHALRTMPGAIPDVRPYYHGVFAPDLSWESTIRLVIALRLAGLDFNTLEIQ